MFVFKVFVKNKQKTTKNKMKQDGESAIITISLAH